MNITVYLGAKEGNDPALKRAVQELGQWIGPVSYTHLAAEQAENFLNGTRLTASMVSAFIENVFVYDGGRIVVRFKYEQSIQDAVKALHTG